MIRSVPRVSFVKTVSAGRDRMFGVATDYEGLEAALPRYFPRIKIRSRRDNVAVVEQHLCIAGKKLIMMTKHIVTHPGTHEIVVIGGDAKGSRITETYEEAPHGTRVTFTADIRLGGMSRLTGMFEGKKIQKGFSAMIDELATVAGR